MPIRAELHCHNSFSNFHLGAGEPPYDCDVTIRDQLERAHALGIDAIFVTNHNTLDGYGQLLEYRNNHAKLSNIGVYPAEEITTDTGAHVLAYATRFRPARRLPRWWTPCGRRAASRRRRIRSACLTRFGTMPRTVT